MAFGLTLKRVVGKTLGVNQNSSDPAAVLNAGWQAMQSVDKRLAAAVSQMPPQVARNVVMQYTNAIRLGKQADASALAIETAKAGLSQLTPNDARRYGVRDQASFDKAIAPAPAKAGFGVIAVNPAQQQKLSADAFKNVNSAYKKYDSSQEVIMPGDYKPRELSLPDNWSPAPMASPQTQQPRGLVNFFKGR